MNIFKSLQKKDAPNYNEPDLSILETFPNPGCTKVDIDVLEFTSLCPVTGMPDYNTISISYFGNHCVESKSLKLYLLEYRMYGCFCEALSVRICEDLAAVLDPDWISVKVIQQARGGIAIQATSIKRRSDDLLSDLLTDKQKGDTQESLSVQ